MINNIKKFTIISTILLLIIAIFASYNLFVNLPTPLYNDKIPKLAKIEKKLLKKEKRVIRILAIDGGGVRGILPAHVLQYLENNSGKPISALFDVIAGTSTGSIAAAFLTVPDSEGKPKYNTNDLIAFYKNAPEFLQAPWYHKLLTLNGLIGPKVPSRKLHEAYKHTLGENLQLRQLTNNVLITAYSLSGKKPTVFKSWEDGIGKNVSFYAYQAVASSTATPTIFSPVIIKDLEHTVENVLIDGAVVLNDPSMEVLVEAMKLYPGHEYRVVSLGTGDVVPTIQKGEAKHWGLVQWGFNAIVIMLQGSNQVVNKQMQEMSEFLKNGLVKYHRFNLIIPKPHQHAFDYSKKNIAALNTLAEQFVKDNKDRLDKIIKHLEE